MYPVFLGIFWLCTRLIMSNQANTQVCGKVIDNTLKSPGYPKDYPNGTDCIYVVSIPHEMDMKITFKDFAIEYGPSCKYDHLMISNDQNYKYGVYCGERTGHTVLVNGSYVVIRFYSDENFELKGFLLFFAAVQTGNRTTTQQSPNACGQVVNNTLKSPGYPENYKNGTDCFYVVPIPQGTRLNIIFQDFDVEHELHCRFDYLMITSIDKDNNLNLGKHCGEKTGQTTLVTGDYAVLTFHSDEIKESKGFFLVFTAIPEEFFTLAVSPSQVSGYSNITRFQNASMSSTAPSIGKLRTSGTDTQSWSTLVVVVISVSAGVTVGAIGLAVPCYIWRRRRQRSKNNNNNVLQKQKDACDAWEVKRDDVIVAEELGQGAFGKVYKGTMKVPSLKKKSLKSTTAVAVKILQDNPSPEQKSDFLDEINLMKAVGSHKNIVSLIGCCTKSTPNFLIVEFAGKGDLLSYLRERRKKVKNTEVKGETYLQVRENPPPVPPRSLCQENGGSENETGRNDIGQVNVAFSKTNSSIDIRINSAQSLMADEEQEQNDNEDEDDSLTSQDMLSFSWQIAQGMRYLSEKNIIHRDLAARNVLVCEKKLVKVADFGLARSTMKENVYRGTGQHNRLPVRWMSPEAINDGVFTTKSDVWSYGILLWEIATFGGFPYPGIRNREIMRLLRRGYRMEKPDTCSEEFYQLITRCWEDNPDMRPTFTELCQDLEVWMQRDTPYLDVDQVDEDLPYYDASAMSASSGSSCEEHAPECPNLNTTAENLS